MNILIIHEVDWLKKVTYEIHHLSELFSLNGHNVFAVDVPDPGLLSIDKKNYQTLHNYHRVYPDASITLFRTPTIPIKGVNRISAYHFSYRFIKKILKNQKIDVVLLYSVVTNAKATVKACKELNIPIIHRTFDIIHDLIRENYLRNRYSPDPLLDQHVDCPNLYDDGHSGLTWSDDIQTKQICFHSKKLKSMRNIKLNGYSFKQMEQK